MAKLYQADGDKKSRADAESKRIESEKKIQLLQTALKRYKNLHVLDVEEEEDGAAICIFKTFQSLLIPIKKVLVPMENVRRICVRNRYLVPCK